MFHFTAEDAAAAMTPEISNGHPLLPPSRVFIGCCLLASVFTVRWRDLIGCSLLSSVFAARWRVVIGCCFFLSVYTSYSWIVRECYVFLKDQLGILVIHLKLNFPLREVRLLDSFDMLEEIHNS